MIKTNPFNASQTTNEWQRVDWAAAEKVVRKLQVRIAKAIKERKYRKAKSLQWILTHSRSAKLLAVRKVTTNKGKKTPGTDGEVWNTNQQKVDAVDQLNRRGYKSLPLRRIYIPKKNGRKRPLSIPSMFDRATQALHLLALSPVAETMSDNHSYGFREGRSCADALQRTHLLLSKSNSPEWVLEADIKSCFDEISHQWMLQNIPMDKRILRQWLKAGHIEQGKLYPTQAGTPQGGVASPCLANITLDGLQHSLKEHFTRYYGHPAPKVNLVRYADDFIVTGSSKELLENEAIPLIKKFLLERGLRLSEEKTKITHITEGFDFLGHNIRKYDNCKLIIKPAKGAIKGVLDKVRTLTKSSHHLSLAKIVSMVNPIIRGWAYFYRHHCSSKAFSYVDHQVFWCLWRWLRKKYPTRSREWIYQRCYTSNSTRRWILRAGDATLFHASSIKIRRHVMVRDAANPYDPVFDPYFQRRRSTTYRTKAPA